MASDLYNYFNGLGNDELLEIYNHKNHEYRADALSVMETILEQRNIPFDKKEKQVIVNKKPRIATPKEYEPLNKKLFYKILLILMLLGIAGVFGKVVQLEGKLFTSDTLMMGLYKIYIILSFPFAFFAEKADLSFGILIIYILNIAFLAWVFTRVLMWIKRI